MTILSDKEALKDLELQLAHGMEVNARNEEGFTPLEWAITNEWQACAEHLLSCEALVNQPGLNGDTPLHLAVRQGNPDIIELVLAWGANPLIANKSGQIPIDLAIGDRNDYVDLVPTLELAIQFNDLPWVKRLIEEDKNLVYQEKTAVEQAAQYGRIEIADYLLQHGWDGWEGANKYEQEMLAAIGYHQIAMLDYLAQKGAVLDTPFLLSAAIISNDMEVFHWVLSHGQDIQKLQTFEDELDGDTYLHVAAKYGNIEAARFLLENGLDFTKQNKLGLTPLAVIHQESDDEDAAPMQRLFAEFEKSILSKEGPQSLPSYEEDRF